VAYAPHRCARAADKTSLACIRAAEDGQAARDRGELLHAREIFAACAARECPAVLRRDCTGWLEDARRQTPSVVIVARDTAGRDLVDVQVSLDGVLREAQLDGTAIELDPGPHVVRVEAAGSDPVEERVMLAAGEKNRTINVTLAAHKPPAATTPGAPPASARVAPPAGAGPAQEPGRGASRGGGLPFTSYLFGGVALAGFGVFGYFGYRGMSDADHLRNTCVPACRSADVDAVHSKLVVADVALGVGVVSLAVATWITVSALGSRSEPSHGQEGPRAGRVGVGPGDFIVRF
jgi:hypothetical protein